MQGMLLRRRQVVRTLRGHEDAVRCVEAVPRSSKMLMRNACATRIGREIEP